MRATTPHRHFSTVGRWAAAASFAALLVAVAPAAADGVTGLAEKLSALRGEVEQLSAELAREDADIRDQLKALSRQKTELELELKKEQTRIQKVHLSIKERRERVSEEQGRDEELTPLFEESLKEVQDYVRASLPFRTTERLAELGKIEEQHKQGLLSTSKALSRLWTFVEDEFRLTRESGLYKQAVEVDGQEHLAEVTRIGMVLLYFRVDDRFVGQARRAGDTWKFERIDNAEHQKLVLELFESFKKQIRVGLFRVPASLPSPVESTIPESPAAPPELEETDATQKEASEEGKSGEEEEDVEGATEKAATAPGAPTPQPKIATPSDAPEVTP